MRTSAPTRRRHRPPNAPSLDPYVVQGTTWTREELLRARGIPVRRADDRKRRPQPRVA